MKAAYAARAAQGLLSFSKRWRAPGRFLSKVPVSWALGPKIGPMPRTSWFASFRTRSEGVENYVEALGPVANLIR
jgi:hypothetical protein